MAKRILFAAPWWHEELMRHLAGHAASRGWHLNLEVALSGRLPRDWRGDGIITNLSVGGEVFHRFWRQADCPAVCLSLNHPEVAIPRVGIDNQAVGRLAAEHLLERSFTSYLFYARMPSHAGRLRSEAFMASMAARGVRPGELIAPFDRDNPAGQWSMRQQALGDLLERLPGPLGVFCEDDASAVEVIEASQTLGLDVPRDVGVLGVLDMPLFRQSTTVPISSIRVDFDAYACRVCDLLAAQMDGGKSTDRLADGLTCEPVLMQPEGVITRDSTDTIAARTPAVVRTLHHLMAHYAEPISVADMVAVSGVSQTGLYAAFHKDVGQSPGSILTQIRLEKAKRKLRETSDKLDAVAVACGFGERITLYRQFKQHTGLSPNAYRKQTRSWAGDERARR